MTQEERTRLAWMMLENTFAAASRVRSVDRIAIVTLYEPAIALAKALGFDVILETEQISESHSVDFGSKEAKKSGADAVLRLPIDLPLITTEDIETILAEDQPAPPVVIVPSRDGTGTNAILRRPPDLFPSHFGAGSLVKHIKEAERVKAVCKLINLPRIALDIDEPEDLIELMKSSGESALYDLLAELKIGDRLKRVT